MIVAQLRRQIFRQAKQKFARAANPARRIFVKCDGKDTSKCATKATVGHCAVLLLVAVGIDLINDTVLKGLLGSHEVVAVGVPLNLLNGFSGVFG